MKYFVLIICLLIFSCSTIKQKLKIRGIEINRNDIEKIQVTDLNWTMIYYVNSNNNKNVLTVPTGQQAMLLVDLNGFKVVDDNLVIKYIADTEYFSSFNLRDAEAVVYNKYTKTLFIHQRIK